MVNVLSCFLFFLALCSCSLSSPNTIDPQPESRPSFKINLTQAASGCSYTVSITTSCSSPSYTRDAISLAFGDAYGNEVSAPRLDDPSSGNLRVARQTHSRSVVPVSPGYATSISSGKDTTVGSPNQ